MKRCPTCNQIFEEDWLSFCTQDGTTLIEDAAQPADPPPTILSPPPAEASAQNQQAAWDSPSAQLPPSAPQWEPPQPMASAWQPPPPPAYAQPQNTSLATAAMVVGILSLFCLGPIPAIVAIVLGAVALSQMNKMPDKFGGRQSAWVGIIVGGVTILIYIAILIFYVVVIVAANS
jgi:hypothetical protein